MCVFKTSGGLETVLCSALPRIMHIYVRINRQNVLKYSFSNKAFEAAARDVSVLPRQIYDCCTAINFKSVFIPVTFIGIIADILYPVKNWTNTEI